MITSAATVWQPSAFNIIPKNSIYPALSSGNMQVTETDNNSSTQDTSTQATDQRRSYMPTQLYIYNHSPKACSRKEEGKSRGTNSLSMIWPAGLVNMLMEWEPRFAIDRSKRHNSRGATKWRKVFAELNFDNETDKAELKIFQFSPVKDKYHSSYIGHGGIIAVEDSNYVYVSLTD